MRLLGALGTMLLLTACNPYVVQDARITGSGSYETGGGTETAARGKSKVKGFGSACSDSDECEHWGLDCARHICTFPCKTDQDCAEAKGRCIARVSSSLPDVPKVCVP